MRGGCGLRLRCRPLCGLGLGYRLLPRPFLLRRRLRLGYRTLHRRCLTLSLTRHRLHRRPLLYHRLRSYLAARLRLSLWLGLGHWLGLGLHRLL